MKLNPKTLIKRAQVISTGFISNAERIIKALISKTKGAEKNIKQRKRMSVAVCVVFMAVIAIGSLSEMKLTFAHEVFVDGNSVGIVKDAQTYENVVKEVETELVESGLEPAVEVETTYVLRVVTENELTSEPELKQEVMANCGDTISAVSLYLGEERIFSAVDEETAKNVTDAFANQFVTEEMENVEITFPEEMQYVEEYVAVSDVKTFEAALEFINNGTQSNTGYIVCDGDTLWTIAEKHDMSYEEFMELNEGTDAILPGDVVTVEKIYPLINVQISYTRKGTMEIPYDNDEIKDSSMAKGTTVVVKEGILGEKNVEESIISVNGEITSSEIIFEEVTKEPVKGTVRVGTNNGPDGSKGCFAWPTSGTISSRFGPRSRDNHKGLDIAAPTGTPIYASAAGTVKYASTMSGYGYIIIISHANGYETYYAHCSQLLVSAGQKVNTGDLIAKVGSTGISTGPHCHFEVRHNGVAKNPEIFLR